jgi:hypothetical protein
MCQRNQRECNKVSSRPCIGIVINTTHTHTYTRTCNCIWRGSHPSTRFLDCIAYKNEEKKHTHMLVHIIWLFFKFRANLNFFFQKEKSSPNDPAIILGWTIDNAYFIALFLPLLQDYVRRYNNMKKRMCIKMSVVSRAIENFFTMIYSTNPSISFQLHNTKISLQCNKSKYVHFVLKKVHWLQKIIE